RRHTRFSRDWSSDVCSSDLNIFGDLLLILECKPKHILVTVDNGNFVRVMTEPGAFVAERIKNNKIELLCLQLLQRIFLFTLCFQCKPYHKLSVLFHFTK